MCGPIAAVLGGVISGIGAAMQVKQQQNQANMQADFEKRDAEIERMRGAYEGARKGDEIKRVRGAQRAAFIANGIDADAGSAEAVRMDSDTEMELDRRAIAANSANAASTKEYQSKITRASAPSGAAAALAFVAPVISAFPSDGKLFA
jgi:hypothetical protein